MQAQLFDGRSGRGRPVLLRLEGGHLVAEAPADPAGGDAPAPLRWPLAQVQWPERTRHGQRVLQLQQGGSLVAADAAAFDAWRREQLGARESWVVRAQQHWRATAAALLLLLATAAAGYQWGVPLASRGLLQLLPPSIDATWGAEALEQIDERWMRASKLPPARQQALRRELSSLVAAAYPPGQAPVWQLHFREAHASIGANAFALPGGHIVVTDQLLERLQGHDDTVLGVLAHELGHVQHRHGMQALVQLAFVGTAASVALGDFSSWLAGSLAVLGQMGYSRDAERQADAAAVQLLRASGRSPAVMLVLFERLRGQTRERGPLPLALASHPLDAEREAFFRAAAATR